jgi:deoxycytidine triphosphate deaminase
MFRLLDGKTINVCSTAASQLHINPLNNESLQKFSYTAELGSCYYREAEIVGNAVSYASGSRQVWDVDKLLTASPIENRDVRVSLGIKRDVNVIFIPPSGSVLVHTKEHILCTPNIIIEPLLHISLAFSSLTMTSQKIIGGYRGKITAKLTNNSKANICLVEGQPFLELYFYAIGELDLKTPSFEKDLSKVTSHAVRIWVPENMLPANGPARSEHENKSEN